MPDTVFFVNGRPDRIVSSDSDYCLKQTIADEKLILNNILNEFLDIHKYRVKDKVGIFRRKYYDHKDIVP